MKEDLNCSGIYQIRNLVNGKIYVGSAVNIKKRWKGHLRDLIKNIHHNVHLQRAFNKYKKFNFNIMILDKVKNKKYLIQKEQYWIDKTKYANKKYGYNIASTAGSSLGLKMSDESKIKISKAKIGNKVWLGKKHTEKSKRKMSEAQKGRKHTEETKLKISKPVAQINPDNNLVITTWNSMTEVEEFFELWQGAISQAIHRQTKTKGFIWRKVDKKTGEIIDPRNI